MNVKTIDARFYVYWFNLYKNTWRVLTYVGLALTGRYVFDKIQGKHFINLLKLLLNKKESNAELGLFT